MPWVKGQSGNPFGRPHGATTLQAVRAFRKYETDIFTAFKSLLTDPDGKVRAKGVELGLAYLFGKPSDAPPPAAGETVPMLQSPDALNAAEAMLESPAQDGSAAEPGTSDAGGGNGSP